MSGIVDKKTLLIAVICGIVGGVTISLVGVYFGLSSTLIGALIGGSAGFSVPLIYLILASKRNRDDT